MNDHQLALLNAARCHSQTIGPIKQVDSPIIQKSTILSNTRQKKDKEIKIEIPGAEYQSRPDNSVTEITCNDHLHLLNADERIELMDECWRILKPEGKLCIRVPHGSCMRSYADPMCQWPPIFETSFVVFNREWREKNKKTQYPIKSNFDFGYGFTLAPHLSGRNEAYVQDAVRDHNNAAVDLLVTLTKRQ